MVQTLAFNPQAPAPPQQLLSNSKKLVWSVAPELRTVASALRHRMSDPASETKPAKVSTEAWRVAQSGAATLRQQHAVCFPDAWKLLCPTLLACPPQDQNALLMSTCCPGIAAAAAAAGGAAAPDTQPARVQRRGAADGVLRQPQGVCKEQSRRRFWLPQGRLWPAHAGRLCALSSHRRAVFGELWQPTPLSTGRLYRAAQRVI